MAITTNDEALLQIEALLERERGHLRDANRANRDVQDAVFFGDEATSHNRLIDAAEATYAALICADEVADLISTTRRKEGNA